jgi:hypothetical protein
VATLSGTCSSAIGLAVVWIQVPLSRMPSKTFTARPTVGIDAQHAVGPVDVGHLADLARVHAQEARHRRAAPLEAEGRHGDDVLAFVDQCGAARMPPPAPRPGRHGREF